MIPGISTVIVCNGSSCEEFTIVDRKYYYNCNAKSMGGIRVDDGVFSLYIRYDTITGMTTEKVYYS
ncbi:hypothetical protein PIROE2DRAFT_1506 [Piromyces sp. E2]|nr:hypothetical protein PIROE2DRAFT_1506 [Piromyces sp. E2]|eukprot:OUM70364.1 hypothetical protein PIROE2DRAFT_1506 [Piromyces sp. E2]